MIPPGYQGMVLFPCAEAQELDRGFIDRFQGPFVLIALDGRWGQAARMLRREPSLSGLPVVKLPAGNPSSYRLRKQSHQNRVCTFEAVARALGVIEGREVQKTLESFFELSMERILAFRGKMKTEPRDEGISAFGP